MSFMLKPNVLNLQALRDDVIATTSKCYLCCFEITHSSDPIPDYTVSSILDSFARLFLISLLRARLLDGARQFFDLPPRDILCGHKWSELHIRIYLPAHLPTFFPLASLNVSEDRSSEPRSLWKAPVYWRVPIYFQSSRKVPFCQRVPVYFLIPPQGALISEGVLLFEVSVN